jgi:hypothetical protein
MITALTCNPDLVAIMQATELAERLAVVQVPTEPVVPLVATAPVAEPAVWATVREPMVDS